jgi:hypothetical protein
MTSSTKPGVAFWATAVVVTVVLYVLSFGPACWTSSWTRGTGAQILPVLYRPILMTSGRRISEIGEWYACACAKDSWSWRWSISIKIDGPPKTTCEWQDGSRWVPVSLHRDRFLPYDEADARGAEEGTLLDSRIPRRGTFRDPEFTKPVLEDSASR